MCTILLIKRCYESADISWFRLFWSPNHSKCSATHSPNSSYTEAYMQGYNWNAPLIFQCSALHTYTHWTAIGEQFGFQYLPHENFDVSPGGSWDRTTDLSINGLPVLLSRATRIQADSCRNKRGRAQITFLLTASKRWRAALGTVWLHRGRNRQIIVVY